MSVLTSPKNMFPKLEKLLPETFPQVKFITIEKNRLIHPVQLDFKIRTRFKGITKTWLCEVKPKGEPRYIYEAVGRFNLARKSVANSYPIILVPFMSQEGKEICKQADIGYICLTGEYYLNYDSVFLERVIHGHPALKIKSMGSLELPKRIRRHPFPFGSASSRILRVFLENPTNSWTITKLSAESGTSLRMGNLVVNYLADQLLINKKRGDIVLAKPKDLLDLWADHYDLRKEHQYMGSYSLAKNFDEFLEKLRSLPPKRQNTYALTLYGGANLVSSYMRFGENHLYVEGDPKEWTECLDLKPAESGANTILITPRDEFVLYHRQKLHGVTVVSNIQLYLDLYNFNDRAREQAQFLYNQVIKF